MKRLPPNAARPTGHVRWNILGVLVAMAFVAYILRQNINVAGESMLGDLGISTVQLGMVFAAFNWSYALFQIPWGAWGDRVGPGRVLTVAVLIWSATTLVTGIAPGWIVLAGAPLGAEPLRPGTVATAGYSHFGSVTARGA